MCGLQLVGLKLLETGEVRASLHPPAVVADRRLELLARGGELPLVLTAPGPGVLDQPEAGEAGEERGGVDAYKRLLEIIARDLRGEEPDTPTAGAQDTLE
jgi:hypothetical protein